MKHPVKSKTIWLNAIVILLGAFVEFVGVGIEEGLIVDAGLPVMAIGVANMILRFLTGKPLSLKGGSSAKGTSSGSAAALYDAAARVRNSDERR
jgi:hypothetical protein